jgi:hypothetical protein
LLVGSGVAFMGWFFVYETSVAPEHRVFRKELTLASIAAVLLGFGVVFLTLWAGVWV